MIYTEKIQQAINFAIKVHAIDQNQTRKGKKVPYITHPLAVALILAQAGASEKVIIAGILHDTLEDCKPHGSVTKELLAAEFGDQVAEMVDDVSEQDPTLPWDERKQLALDHVKHMSQGSLYVKSADLLHNLTDQLFDYKIEGDEMFKRFNAPKEKQLTRYTNLIGELKKAWPTNPLILELQIQLKELTTLWS